MSSPLLFIERDLREKLRDAKEAVSGAVSGAVGFFSTPNVLYAGAVGTILLQDPRVYDAIAGLAKTIGEQLGVPGCTVVTPTVAARTRALLESALRSPQLSAVFMMLLQTVHHAKSMRAVEGALSAVPSAPPQTVVG